MIVRLLLDHGANINAQGGKYGNALQAACYEGHEMIIRLLLDHGADVNAQGGTYGNALQTACCSYDENETIVRLLLDRGAIVNDHDEGRSSKALQEATDWDYRAIVQLLLDHGAVYPENGSLSEHSTSSSGDSESEPAAFSGVEES